jgi:Arc/MetJ family transcription regulator
MPTNLAIDDQLIEEARVLGGYKTKKDAVNAALRAFVQRHKQAKILDLLGAISYDPEYRYKVERQREAT